MDEPPKAPGPATAKRRPGTKVPRVKLSVVVHQCVGPLDIDEKRRINATLEDWRHEAGFPWTVKVLPVHLVIHKATHAPSQWPLSNFLAQQGNKVAKYTFVAPRNA